ncbi:MAG: hypothetical protein ACLP7P_08600 [Rhodomicrobium sp.]
MEAFPAMALAGGVAQGVGAFFGGQTQADAYSKAANQANNRWNEAYGAAQPFIQGGQNALNSYNTAMGIGPSGTAGQNSYWANLASNPAFQTSVNYGLKQIQATNAAQGLNLSGNEAAALQNYSQQNLLNFGQTNLDDLFKEANLGAGSANAAMSSSTGASNSIGGFMGNAGASAGNSYAALGNTGLGITNNLGNYYYGTGSGTKN